jgi:hypothetical protein
LTLAVQLGLVVGTFTSTLFNFPDVFSARRLVAVSALAGALANALFALLADGPSGAIPLFRAGIAA